MYIRTKDGVYKIDEVKPYFLDEKQKLFINNELKVAINEQRVINQSENIEELCDEFVGVDKTCENGHQLLRAVPYKCANFWNGGVYGAVWCEWGLKYVAKLDDKGELHLL